MTEENLSEQQHAVEQEQAALQAVADAAGAAARRPDAEGREKQQVDESGPDAVPADELQPASTPDQESEREVLRDLERMQHEHPEEDQPNQPASDAEADLSVSEIIGGTGVQIDEEESLPTVKKVQFGDLDGGPAAGEKRNIDILMEVKLPISIELGRTQMTVQDILALGPGSVVELDKLAGEPVDLLVNNKVIAKGEVVVVDENFGLRVTSLASPEDRIKSL